MLTAPAPLRPVDRVDVTVVVDLGGMHLTGSGFADIIPATIEDVVATAPDHLVAGHCTGYRARAELVQRLPDRFLASSVGSLYRFTA